MAIVLIYDIIVTEILLSYENDEFIPENGEHFVPVGDANNDTYINTADATEILRYSVGMATNCVSLLGDANRDGIVNTGDAVLILKYAAGMIAGF